MRYPNAGEHVEAPLSKQVLVFTKGDKPFAIYPVSSGKSSTPTVTGHFEFIRTEPGYNSHGMYYSFYFYGGYAVHGYESVPDYPASHGCLRTFIADQPRDLRTLHHIYGETDLDVSSSGGRRLGMKVFVAGASGAIGRPLVRQLSPAGHEVTGMTRREERAEEIRGAGARGGRLRRLRCRGAERGGGGGAAGGCHPCADRAAAEVQAAQRLPGGDQPGPHRGDAQPARRGAGGGRARLVAESIAFLYEPEGDWVKDEEAPLFDGAPGASARRGRRSPTSSGRCSGPRDRGARPALRLALRPWHLLRPRRLPGRGNAASGASRSSAPAPAPSPSSTSRTPPRATVAALERGAPGIYNVVDDEPAPLSEWLPVYAEALGAKPPRRVPVWLARLVAGGAVAGAAD